MILCSLFSVLGSFARLWFVYDTDMRSQETKRREAATRHMRKSELVSEK
jgi:hypothetical protein